MAERALSAGNAARPARAGLSDAGQRKRGLPPVLGRDTRVLILGSFPGEASLAAGQYYAHPRNHFWPLIGALTATPLATMPYRERLAALRAHGIGLWDVYVACSRRGSLDGAIRDAERGEMSRVRRAAPALRLVCFNGQTAARALPSWRSAGYATLALPSSSPAYTRPFSEKLARWREIGDFLESARSSPRGSQLARPAPALPDV
jgi:hypoxanthine-DNA glycosylase